VRIRPNACARVKAPAWTADDIVVTDQADVRCPHCGALLRAGAEWCTLCYADLRPKPEPEPVAVSVLEPSYAATAAPAAPVDPLTAPLSALEAAALAITNKTPPDPEADPSAAPVGWPCSGCEAVVSFDEDACPTCGTRFLDGARGAPDLLDRIGPGGLPVSTQSLIIAGGAAAMIAVIVAAMYIIGTIF
jgi:RNA polymerase subunit RPABC4/transcription elongation factor Spt4